MPRYSGSVFLGAFLLFFLQPLMGRLLLPSFGGGTAVWTACLVFFQGGLFLGYAYAFLLRRVSVRSQVATHLGLLALAAVLLLTVSLEPSWRPAPEADPVVGVWKVLVGRVGLPYVLLAATAPSVQRWLELARPHLPAYRLYALSNLAAFAALFLYPTVAERYLTRAQEALGFRVGFLAFGLTIAVAGLDALRRAGDARAAAEPGSAGSGTGRRLAWWGLPALSSALLVAVTQALAEDVPPMPFLWVLPLGLYLLSYVVAFRGWGWTAGPVVALGALLSAGVPVAPFPTYGHGNFGAHVFFLCAALFLSCVLLHGLVYRLRPATSGGSAFYLALAGGGVVGGLLVALGAPRVFDTLAELPILLAAVMLVAVLRLALAFRRPLTRALARVALVPSWLVFVFFLAGLHREPSKPRLRERNAYGVHTVYELREEDALFDRYELHSGGIVHGIQFLREDARREPTAYFTRSSGVGLALRAFPTDRPLSVGVVGLGAGTLAAYANEGDHFRFYELDPKVIRVAREPFRFLADSPARIDVVPGDARLSLEDEPDQGFDLLVVDAFCGDAIPVHLLTVECFEIYLRHLRPSGVIAIHASSLYFDLIRVLARTAAALELAGVWIHREARVDVVGLESTWVLLSRSGAFFRHPELAPHARPLAEVARPATLWTDERTPLLEVIRWTRP